MIRRAFVRMFSGAVFATMLGVKVETWKLEDFGVGGFDSEASGLEPGFVTHWSSVPWSLTHDGVEVARGVGLTPHGDGMLLNGTDEIVMRPWE